MPSQVTVLSDDGDWKAEVDAWKHSSPFYSSIGTRVAVYHREPTTNTRGRRKTRWVRRAADAITIRNTYGGQGPGTGVRTRVVDGRSTGELKEWAFGATVSLPADPVTDVGGGPVCDLDRVLGDVTVWVGHQSMSAQVEAANAFAGSRTL